MQHEPRVASTTLRTSRGEFNFFCFSWGEHEEDNVLCLANRSGTANLGGTDLAPLCRVQSACYTAEIFQSVDCDCHEQLHTSLAMIREHGGVLVYMLCDGRGAGLFNKTLGLELGRTDGLDTSDAYARLGIPQDPREYSRVAFALKHLGLLRIRLLTNNPRKIDGIAQHGITVERCALEIASTRESESYLRTKATKMGHLLSEFEGEEIGRPEGTF
ncbi:GTP cyclohydrolase II [Eleftheria terrae]|uniref:GTP cyclohydrolase II n=1 Tax=Eleftheria terrae TaxID=1597781 RepID=UPI00263A6042|nr:GTP cyclohydrolase II [Eleftheria terrae]WKB55977.1 GTP cyclohydrolase II [Eleftheria terrae]